MLVGTHLVVVLIHPTHKEEGGHELTKLVVGQGDGIVEASVDFAVLSEEILGDLLVVISLERQLFNHVDDMIVFIFELIVDVSPGFVYENVRWLGQIRILPFG